MTEHDRLGRLPFPEGQPFGDLSALNTTRLVLDSAGKEILTHLAAELLAPLGTSAVVSEKTGDYALGLFTSGWCRMMVNASRNLCETDDDREAMACGRWHCHESCWQTSKAAIDTNAPADQPCRGGIRIHAVPIRAGGEVVGAINFGYGDPPRDPQTLQELASRFDVSVEALRERARTHQSMSPFVIESAKSHLDTVARLIGALVERAQAERRLAVQHAVARIIAESTSSAEATPRILQAVCDTNRWLMGDLWEVDEQAHVLRCVTVWHGPEANYPEFERETRRLTFPPGVGLPGRVWTTGEPAWIADVTPDPNFPRAAVASKEGIRGAFGFPIRYHEQVLGVMEFFSPAVRPPDRSLLALFDSIGSQLGQFMMQKRQEAELRQAEAKYRGIFESSVDGIFQSTPDGRLLMVNPAMARILGYRTEDLISTIRDVGRQLYVQTESREQLKHMLERDGLVRGFECQFRRKDGGTMWVSITARAVRDAAGTIACYEGTAEDVTERRSAESALRQTARMLEDLFEAAPDAIAIVNREGRIVRVNRQAATTFQYQPDELSGQPVEILVPDRLRGGHVKLRQAYMGEPRTRPMGGGAALVARRKDGSEFPCRISLGSLATGEGPLVLAIIRDVTDEKRLEGQLRQAQKMEAVGSLAGGIAHDFNNLLTVINGYCDLVLRETPTDSPARVPLAEMLNAGHRAADLTRQLLAFSRKQILEPKSLDLNHLLADLERMLHRLIGEDVVLRIVPGTGLWPVLADPGQLQQVLMNLAVNARDAMPQGGTLTFEAANVEKDERSTEGGAGIRPGAYVRLTVIDTGHGMDESTLARIFEPFFTTKGPEKGTGLGLAVVYGIVKQSGGFIYVQSEPARGTTFTVYLPRHDGEALPLEEADQPRASLHGNETILLVEDEKAVRALAARILRGYGYTVLEAGDGRRALAVATAHTGPIQLLITDVIMPRLSGRELAEQLVASHPALSVLYVSGYTADIITTRGALEPNVAFLPKPFTPADLARKVRKVLDKPAQERR